MVLDMSRWWEAASVRRPGRALRLRLLRAGRHLFSRYRFNSITRRIIVINIVGVAVLVSGILYLNQYRVKFIGTRVENLTTQAQIIATAIAQTSKNGGDTAYGSRADDRLAASSGLSNPDLSFRVDPEVVSPMLRDLVGPTKTRARVFDPYGTLISDSLNLYTRAPASRAADGGVSQGDPDFFSTIWAWLRGQFWTSDLPIYKEFGADGKSYEEVRVALAGSLAPLIRVSESGDIVISIAVPIQRDSATLGALLLTAQGGDIDDMIARDRLQIVEVAALVAVVTAILSLLLASTIAEPMRRLAVAAERVRRNIKNREQIPDFSDRPDEIGHLSRAFRDMTNALYSRLDAIESFAADVSHELKNPLTSLRNAASLLPRVKNDEDRDKLVEIIKHDVRRLDRLITDISDASRLDAELAREMAKPVDMAKLLQTLCEIQREVRRESGIGIVLNVEGCATEKDFVETRRFIANGNDSRLSQVIANLLDNAISFSPKNGSIYVSARRLPKKDEIEISVEDEGPGIRDENLEKIFERFYTDRPESFGQNSGLGLNISQQIVKAHGGHIWAENRTSPKPLNPNRPAWGGAAARTPVPTREEAFACGVKERYSWGARFVIRLPACPLE
ncbi:sensor histidine kinase [Rhodomicrobium lacus]|uniref:sensor histidine kinase n=1 Tax=Rhodomicrobium lacus TaxID=2498452 RepID=UPI001FE0AC99|nr:sensor histidine kinase [Rhodomicrobium lacus]